MENILIEKTKLLNKALTNFIATGAVSIQEYTINCSDLNDKFLIENICDSDEYRDMFTELMKIDINPCIYYFEVLSAIEPEIIVESLKGFAAITDKRIPAIKSNCPTNSNILYIGKVNSCFWGRLITHLGFHTHKTKSKGKPTPSSNHGLQLFYWAKDLDLRLKIKVIAFNPEMKGQCPRYCVNGNYRLKNL